MPEGLTWLSELGEDQVDQSDKTVPRVKGSEEVLQIFSLSVSFIRASRAREHGESEE